MKFLQHFLLKGKNNSLLLGRRVLTQFYQFRLTLCLSTHPFHFRTVLQSMQWNTRAQYLHNIPPYQRHALRGVVFHSPLTNAKEEDSVVRTQSQTHFSGSCGLNARTHVNTFAIQGVSRLVDITAGGDFLRLCDQKSSYKHMSDFGRLRSYDRLKIRR